MKKQKQQKPDITRKAALKQMKKYMRVENEFMKAQGLTRVKPSTLTAYEQNIRDGAIPLSAKEFESLISAHQQGKNL